MKENNPNQIKLTFCGGVGEVTGANFLLEYNNQKILIDCGMVQGGEEARLANYTPFPYDPASIDVLVVTHAHIDHIGRIPKLVKEGFKGKIYSTPYTRDIAPIMLQDSAGLIGNDAEKRDIEPLYTADDAARALELWHIVQYHTRSVIAPGVSIYLRDAGHILGSAIVEMTVGSRVIAFTGDLGNSPSPLLPDTEPVTDVDYMVMESVYGDRNHPDSSMRKENLKNEIKTALARKGTLLIPMFSLEKTQDILHELNEFINKKEIPQVPVFLDSPMGIKITEIYKRAKKEFNTVARAEADRDDIFDFPGLQIVESGMQSREILHSSNPKIVIAGSGMSSGGRVVGHEKVVLQSPQNTVLFLGYQSVGTLGRQITDGAKSVRIYNEIIPVRANIKVLGGYSSHKDSEHLLEFVSHTKGKIKKVFVVMGETRSAMFLAQRINDYLDIPAVHPQEGETVILM